jgi:RNA polymerase sigma-70 factor (ECF subfamily)
MNKNGDFSQLVRQAQVGHKESLDRLAEIAQERLYEHVYRITLRSNLAREIVQESILEMFAILGKLKNADGFWPWLRGIAFNKIRHHHRYLRRRKTVSLSEIGYEPFGKDKRDGLAELISEELKQIVTAAMSNLRPRHRTVLTMRCYDEMAYSQIAQLMGCSEFAARMLFCRAKKALGKQLSHRGLSKGALLLALTVFGKMTASSKAAATQVSVTAASLKVGVAASVAGIVASKGTIMALTAAGAVAAGSVALTNRPPAITQPGQVNGFGADSAITRTIGNIEQCWYYFPDGVAGPVMTRWTNSGSRGHNSYCQWLQNDTGNYYFDKNRNTAYIVNHRMWNQDLTVRSLPTDGPQLTKFLARVQGGGGDMEHVYARGRGLLVVAQRDREQGPGYWRIIRHHNVLEEDYFRLDRPAGSRVINKCDAMHKRGWTYFRIDGAIAGQRVSGFGQIPFFHSTSKRHKPWLRLKVTEGLEIVDSTGGASISNAAGKVLAVYPAGSFFKGLGRPWMGLHTIDTVRRDAAEQQVWFETTASPKDDTARIVLTPPGGKLVYTVDMKTDVVNEIVISGSDGISGRLTFSYLQDIGQAGERFVEPSISSRYTNKRRQSAGILWLIELAEKTAEQKKWQVKKGRQW